jgi:hypothetical protein
MNKQPDFGNDLATLNESVSAEVGDVLQALQQKRTATRPTIVNKKDPAPGTPAGSTPDLTATHEQPAAVSSPRRQRSASRSRLTPTVDRDEPLENVTTRLRLSTNELLTEAALRQRLKKESPATRQDIIETALGDWFRKHGYGRDRDDVAKD